VRYHVCWGSWPGPHTTDVPLRDIADLILKVRAGAYVIEGANPRHEHEWKVWQDVKLPPGKVLMPGVISHATNIVEHPELVCERIVRLARLVGRENIIARHRLAGQADVPPGPPASCGQFEALVEGSAAREQGAVG
jgi:5-methyltetrahydropteroyltriglutamate--homocysteine methyltransferase